MSGDENMPRLSGALNGDGFPVQGPRTPLSDAVIDDALERIREAARLRAQGMLFADIARELGYSGPEAARDAVRAAAAEGVRRDLAERQRRTRAAKEITAAWDAMVNGQETL
jgi:hypothetical protein